ncbi:MAG TPA: hypothetical protein V6D10_07285 [Trichocoleus sp.]|jgi:hypothetical protein
MTPSEIVDSLSAQGVEVSESQLKAELSKRGIELNEINAETIGILADHFRLLNGESSALVTPELEQPKAKGKKGGSLTRSQRQGLASQSTSPTPVNRVEPIEIQPRLDKLKNGSRQVGSDLDDLVSTFEAGTQAKGLQVNSRLQTAINNMYASALSVEFPDLSGHKQQLANLFGLE